MLLLFVLETMEEINDAGLFIKSAVQFCVFFNLRDYEEKSVNNNLL